MKNLRDTWYVCESCCHAYFRINLNRPLNHQCDWCFYVGDSANLIQLSDTLTKRRRNSAYKTPYNKTDTDLSKWVTRKGNSICIERHGVKHSFPIKKFGEGQAIRHANYLAMGWKCLESGEDMYESLQTYLTRNPECINKSRFLPEWVEFRPSKQGIGIFRLRFKEIMLRTFFVQDYSDVQRVLNEVKKSRDALAIEAKRIKAGNPVVPSKLKRAVGSKFKAGRDFPQGAQKCNSSGRYYIRFFKPNTKVRFDASITQEILDTLVGEEAVPVLLEEILDNSKKLGDGCEKRHEYIKFRLEEAKREWSTRKFRENYKSVIEWHELNAEDIIEF